MRHSTPSGQQLPLIPVRGDEIKSMFMDIVHTFNWQHVPQIMAGDMFTYDKPSSRLLLILGFYCSIVF